MTEWESRAPEEQALLNPGFSAALLWCAARGHASAPGPATGTGLPLELGFVVLPCVLHRQTREALPRRTNTSLAAWLVEVPLARAWIADRARLLVPYTREALRFGGTHGLLRFDGGAIIANADWPVDIERALAEASEEVRACATKASFLGRWFARGGGATTVLALLGVRP